MKKLIIVAVFAAILVTGVPVFAQETGHASDFYYVNISLEKIYPHRAGYAVQYSTGVRQLATAYLPIEWFSGTASKAEIVPLPKGNTWPSMTVYYRDGKFSHARLYVHRWASHQTWGTVPQNAKVDGHFDDTDDLKLVF
ncbi:MAG: hypothetical protein FWD36_08130 [Treponema sp.]|nr:hypothetical protein [Treponema sp.]